MTYCYICNKEIDGEQHYKDKGNCRLESNPYHDLWAKYKKIKNTKFKEKIELIFKK